MKENHLLLLRLQMCIFSASLIRSSLNWGCAMLIRSSALCQDVRPFIIAMPYSVTMYMELARVSVTILPFARVGRIRLTHMRR